MTRWRYKNPPKPNSHSLVDQHLLDEHPKNDVYSSGLSRFLREGIRMKELDSYRRTGSQDNCWGEKN